MPKLSHNKRRNVGLVYEFLTRAVTDAMMNQDHATAAMAMGIIGEHFSEGCPLHAELSLHRQVMESRGVSERLARRIVDSLKAAGIRSSAKRSLTEAAKTQLIHSINRGLGREVFDRYRIPNYTAHASVSIIMGRGIDGRIDEGVDMARAEDHLVEFLTTTPGETPVYDRDASLYAYKVAVGLFEEEFGAELSTGQSELLREYIRVTLNGNPAPFERTFERQRNQLREDLRVRRSDAVFKADSDMAKRLDEAILELDGLRVEATDETVERLMLFHALHREVES
jgi:hypothetical protein